MHRVAWFVILAVCLCVRFTAAQQTPWIKLDEHTAVRLPTGPGLNDPSLTSADPEQKAYAWGDVNNDGRVDLVVARKTPFTMAGGKRNVLLMNEGIAHGHSIDGVLVDRTAQYASVSINVPQSELDFAASMNPPQLPITQGFLDLTNDADIALADFNKDGWLDIITATCVSNHTSNGQPYQLPRFLGHPRIYLNQGNDAKGNWLGFVYDYNLMPQLVSNTGLACNPNFNSVAVGDVNNDGFVDLYFNDIDAVGFGSEPPSFDMDSRLLINQGGENAGAFEDQTIPRLAALYNYGGTTGTKPLAYTIFGFAAAIADLNGDRLNDLIKLNAVGPNHIATVSNNPQNPGLFSAAHYKVQYSLSGTYISVGDLNNDARLDMVISDDASDRYLLNSGNDGNGNPTFTSHTFALTSGSDDGFAGNSVIADLNQDGWNDVIITDVDTMGFGCNRRKHVYRNLAIGPLVTMREESPLVIPANSSTGTHDVAVFDINSDGRLDLVIGRCNSMSVWINRVPNPADANGDWSVNVADLLIVIQHWGACVGSCPPYCPGDVSQDCAVNVEDLLLVIVSWS